MNWENAACKCSEVCEPLTPGCSCNSGAAAWMLTESAAARQWAARFPEMANASTDRQCQPAYNNISGNTYCKCGKFIDAAKKDTDAWGSVVENNEEVETC